MEARAGDGDRVLHLRATEAVTPAPPRADQPEMTHDVQVSDISCHLDEIVRQLNETAVEDEAMTQDCAADGGMDEPAPSLDTLRVAADEQIVQRYRDGLAAFNAPQPGRPVGVAERVVAEVVEIGKLFKPKRLASGGNILTRLLARAPTVEAYIRYRAEPIRRRLDGAQERLDGAIRDAHADAEKARYLFDLHRATLNDLRALLEVITTEYSRLRGEWDRLEQDGRLAAQAGIVSAMLEAERAADRVNTRIFLVENDADQITAYVERYRAQAMHLSDAREYVCEIRHKIEMISLAASAGDRTAMMDRIMRDREHMEVMAASVGRASVIRAALDAERPVVRSGVIREIVRHREAAEKAQARILDLGIKDRQARTVMIDTARQNGVGMSVREN